MYDGQKYYFFMKKMTKILILKIMNKNISGMRILRMRVLVICIMRIM